MDHDQSQPFLRWTPAISVGVPEFDDHHRQMVAIINRVHDAVGSGQPSETLSGVIGELLDYANYHFGAEEAQFEGSGYPLESEHIEDHLAFRERLSELRDLIDAGSPEAARELLQFLLVWWTQHITTFDKKYAPYIHHA